MSETTFLWSLARENLVKGLKDEHRVQITMIEGKDQCLQVWTSLQLYNSKFYMVPAIGWQKTNSEMPISPVNSFSPINVTLKHSNSYKVLSSHWCTYAFCKGQGREGKGGEGREGEKKVGGEGKIWVSDIFLASLLTRVLLMNILLELTRKTSKPS